MKKAGFLAVSFVALMTVGVARAEIASTTYVASAISGKENTTNKATDTYTSGSTTQYPSIKVAETIAGKAVEGVSAGLGELSGLDTVGTDEIDNGAVTKAKLDSGVQASLNKADSALQAADITGKENTSNKTTTISNTSTDTQYPSAKAVYTELGKKQNSLGYTAENSANKTATIAAAATASDVKYPTEKAVATALAGKQAAGDYATNSALNAVKTTAESANNQATTNKNAIAGLETSKQDKLTTSNIKGAGSVSVAVAADGVVTVTGTDTKYTLPAATTTALGGVKSGGNITVATDGAVTVNQAASATKATQDASGNVITTTYATKTEMNAVKTTAEAANTQAGTNKTAIATLNGDAKTTGSVDNKIAAAVADVNADLSGKADKATTLAGYGITDGATKSEVNAKVATTTYESQIGAVSAANMGTTATTVVTGIKEAVTEAAAAQSTADTAVANAATAQAKADSAYTLAGAAIPKPSGTCKDCVLKYNGTAFSWEEIGR